MRYRWGKGKKDQNKLPNGEKIVFIKVGGRTSAVVPSVQKKTGRVAGDVKAEESASDEDAADTSDTSKPVKKGRVTKKRKFAVESQDASDDAGEDANGLIDEPAVETTKSTKKGRTIKKRKADEEEKVKTEAKPDGPEETKKSPDNRRRSGRTSRKAQ